MKALQHSTQADRQSLTDSLYMCNINTYTENQVKDQILKTCRLMLVPAVRMLLRAGIGWSEFAEIGKQVFVDVARTDYGLQGRPTNSARVALMTGLSRREVARIKRTLIGEAPTFVESRSRISQVLSGWHLDPEFLDAAGHPAVLPEQGSSGSLFSLIDRFGGDIPRGALIKELLQLELISVDESGYKVKARDYIRSASDADMLRQGGQAIHDHATTIVHNVNVNRSEAPRFERMATQLDVDPEDAELFEQLLADKGQNFLEEMDRWLSERKAARGNVSENRKAVRAGVGMYLIYDEAQGTQHNE